MAGGLDQLDRLVGVVREHGLLLGRVLVALRVDPEGVVAARDADALPPLGDRPVGLLEVGQRVERVVDLPCCRKRFGEFGCVGFAPAGAGERIFDCDMKAPDRRLEDMRRSGRAVRDVPFALPVEQGRLFLRARERNPELFILPDTERAASKVTN